MYKFTEFYVTSIFKSLTNTRCKVVAFTRINLFGTQLKNNLNFPVQVTQVSSACIIELFFNKQRLKSLVLWIIRNRTGTNTKDFGINNFTVKNYYNIGETSFALRYCNSTHCLRLPKYDINQLRILSLISIPFNLFIFCNYWVDIIKCFT